MSSRTGGPLHSVLALAVLCLALVFFTGTTTADQPVVVAAAGDIACDPAWNGFNNGQGTAKTCRQQFTAALLASIGPTAVLPLGDDQYECGGYQAFLGSYDRWWGPWKGITFPAVGNEEYRTSASPGTDCDSAGQAAGYFKYFGAAAGTAGQGYYSYDLGSWHLISLNSNCGQVGGCKARSPQETWLRADLAAHANGCTLAYWHHPRFSSSGDTQGMQTIWADLVAAHADIVLSGHKHNYERFDPQDALAHADPDGIREFVVGTGGRSHQGFSATPHANSVVRNESTFGVLELSLGDGSYSWQFVPEAGQAFTDSGSASCH